MNSVKSQIVWKWFWSMWVRKTYILLHTVWAELNRLLSPNQLWFKQKQIPVSTKLHGRRLKTVLTFQSPNPRLNWIFTFVDGREISATSLLNRRHSRRVLALGLLRRHTRKKKPLAFFGFSSKEDNEISEVSANSGNKAGIITDDSPPALLSSLFSKCDVQRRGAT